MCIIVHNKKGSRKLTKEEFDKAWRINSHGFGVMYVKNHIVESKKTLNKDIGWEIYNAAMDYADDGQVVSHWRMATHGSVNTENTHPFHCGMDSSGGNMMLVHNGVLGYTSKLHPDMSDTRIFCEMLKRLPRGYTEMDEYTAMINKQLSWDKVLIMDAQGNVFYYGDKGVEMDEGIWASNGGATVYKSHYTQLETPKKKVTDSQSLIPKEGAFIKKPSPLHETDECHFYNGCMWYKEYVINKDGYVEYYEDPEFDLQM